MSCPSGLAGIKTVFIAPPDTDIKLPPLWSEEPNHAAMSAAEFIGHPSCAKVDVKAGDALFIPEGWWHLVDSVPFTIAINYWYTSFQVGLPSYHSGGIIVASGGQYLDNPRYCHQAKVEELGFGIPQPQGLSIMLSMLPELFALWSQSTALRPHTRRHFIRRMMLEAISERKQLVLGNVQPVEVGATMVHVHGMLLQQAHSKQQPVADRLV